MNIENLEILIKNGESKTIEFKRSSANLKSAAETLCGFLNEKGGSVFLGVSDSQKIVGQHVTDQTKLEIANILKKFEPTANISVDYVDVGYDKTVVILTAYPDQRCIPYCFDGRSYERKESETHVMSQNRYQQLLLLRSLNPYSWESQIAIGASIEDLDDQEIVQTMKDMRNKKRINDVTHNDVIYDILKRLKLIEAGNITNAAVVLFCKEVPNNFMQCVLRMARFRGIEKGDFIDSRHVFGNTFQLLREAELFINRNTAIASTLKTGKFIRDDQPEYPFNAVREALINAICHRDYASLGGAITITIYDNRMEIANSGILPPEISIDDLKDVHTSHPRNPKITNVFFRRGLIEAMGIGTQEILKSYLSLHMKEPDFYEQAGTFVVRLWSRHFEAEMDNPTLPDRQKNILNLLADHSLSPKALLSTLKEKISDRTLRNDLQSLKQKGYVDSEGKGKQTIWFLSRNTEMRQ